MQKCYLKMDYFRHGETKKNSTPKISKKEIYHELTGKKFYI